MLISYTLRAMQSNTMMKRLLILGIGTSLIQVIGFFFFILIAYWFAAVITYPSNDSTGNDSNGDYIILFIAIIFVIIVLIQNVIAALINRRKVTYILVGISLASYIAALIDMGFSVPLKTELCMIFGFVVLGVKTRIDDRLL